MTLEYLYSSLEKRTGTTLSDREKFILNTMFGDTDKIDAIVYTSEELILNFIISDKNFFIIHEDGIANKLPPKDGEIYFGVLTRRDSFLVFKTLT